LTVLQCPALDAVPDDRAPFLPHRQSEITDSVRVAKELIERWRGTNPDHDADWECNTNEIRNYTRSARESLASLEQGMAIIRSHRRKFRLSEEEVASRAAFIDSTRAQLEGMTRELDESRSFMASSHDEDHSGFRNFRDPESPTTGGSALSAYPPQQGDSGYDFDPHRSSGSAEGITVHVSGMLPGGGGWGEEDTGEERRPGESVAGGGVWRCLGPPACIVGALLLFYVLFLQFPIWSSSGPAYGSSSGG